MFLHYVCKSSYANYTVTLAWGGSTCETKIVAILGATILKVRYLQYSLNKYEYFCHNTVIHDNLCFIVTPAQKSSIVLSWLLPWQHNLTTCENKRSNFYYYWKPCLKPIYACMKFFFTSTKSLQILCLTFFWGWGWGFKPYKWRNSDFPKLTTLVCTRQSLPKACCFVNGDFCTLNRRCFDFEDVKMYFSWSLTCGREHVRGEMLVWWGRFQVISSLIPAVDVSPSACGVSGTF